MNVDWSAYRITAILYLGIILLPVVFYFSYTSFSELQEDTKVINSFTMKSASLMQKNSEVKKVLNDFETFKPWMQKNDNTIFYVGDRPLVQKYEGLLECIKEGEICFKQANSIVFSLNNILTLKQNRIYNLFYINFFITIALLISLIFFTRAFMYKQLRRHFLYDFKSKLYTKEYMFSSLKEMSAQMQRADKPFSLLYLRVKNLNDIMIEEIGKVLLEELRESDVACRYSSDKFVVLLPNTEHTNTTALTERLGKNFTKFDYNLNVLPVETDTDYEDLLNKMD